MPRTALIATAVVIIVLSFAPPSRAQTTQPAAEVALGVQRKLTTNTQLPRAPHRVTAPSDTGAFLIETDNLTLDLNGAALIGAPESTPADQYTGRAIVVRNAKHVTIQNGAIRGFKIAVYAENAPGLTVDNLDLSRNYRQRLKSTPQREHKDDWLWPAMNDNHEWLRYGAGVYLLHCDRAAVRNCRARNGQNGVCLDRCNEVTVEKNDFCFMSGWGVALWRSCRNRVLANRLDYCVRGYSHGVYNRGQDSAGILVFEQSSDNLFAFNSATHCGDGFFLYAGHETLKQTGAGGSNRNILYKNNFSRAVMHGIEATFSEANVFAGNILTDCENGVWAGYSIGTHIIDNRLSKCKTGVAIEHGVRNNIQQNIFTACDRGLWLWWDDDGPLLELSAAKRHGGKSKSERVIGNTFDHCKTALRFDGVESVGLLMNEILAADSALDLAGNTTIALFAGNTIDGGNIVNKSVSAFHAVSPIDQIADSVRLIGPGSLASTQPTQPNEAANDLAMHHQMMGPCISLAEALRRDKITVPTLSENDPCPAREPHRFIGAPADKTSILIDDWGPYDYSTPRVFPAVSSAWKRSTLEILGPGLPFKVVSSTGDIDITPRAGISPATLTISPCAAPANHATTSTVDTANTARDFPLAAIPFTIQFRIGESSLAASGLLLRADWKIDYYKWPDDADPRQGDDHWKKTLATPPLKTETRAAIDFNWGVGRPDPAVPMDKFALVATSRLRLPAGRWKFKTISDDGVRVYLDGKRIIDNWTWHVPAEDSAIVDLPAPPATSNPVSASPPPASADHDIRIEYWDLTGGAQLNFTLEPA